jgi:hypothetical protein
MPHCFHFDRRQDAVRMGQELETVKTAAGAMNELQAHAR